MLLVQYNHALEIFQRAAQRFPKSPETQYFVGIAARGLANYELAEAALRKSLALQSDNTDALAQLGFVLSERSANSEAEAVLRHAIALNARHFYANYNLGRLLVRMKRYDAAIPILRNAEAIRPRDPAPHYQLFIAYSRLKQSGPAERELGLFKQYDAERKASPAETIEDAFPSPANDTRPNEN